MTDKFKLLARCAAFYASDGKGNRYLVQSGKGKVPTQKLLDAIKAATEEFTRVYTTRNPAPEKCPKCGGCGAYPTTGMIRGACPACMGGKVRP